jgi:hypothetical protein
MKPCASFGEMQGFALLPASSMISLYDDDCLPQIQAARPVNVEIERR